MSSHQEISLRDDSVYSQLLSIYVEAERETCIICSRKADISAWLYGSPLVKGLIQTLKSLSYLFYMTGLHYDFDFLSFFGVFFVVVLWHRLSILLVVRCVCWFADAFVCRSDESQQRNEWEKQKFRFLFDREQNSGRNRWKGFPEPNRLGQEWSVFLLICCCDDIVIGRAQHLLQHILASSWPWLLSINVDIC